MNKQYTIGMTIIIVEETVDPDKAVADLILKNLEDAPFKVYSVSVKENSIMENRK